MIEIIGALIGVGTLLFIIWAAKYTKCGPNEVLIISGRKPKERKGKEASGFRVIKGGGTFVWPIKEQVKKMSLEIMDLDVRTPDVYSKEGVPITVDATAQVKVKGDSDSIITAAENFLSKPKGNIMETVLNVVEGHTRETISMMTPEDLYRKRKELAESIKKESESDISKMGMEIISLTIKTVTDSQGYLESLGRPRTAEVKRDAMIGEAKANEEAKKIEYEAETKIEESRRNYETKKSEYDASIAKEKAISDLSYDLQRFKTQQQVKEEEINVGIVEKQKSTELAEKEILRKDKELTAEVVKPAEAERKKIESLAEGEKFRLKAEASGKSESIRSTGYAEADVIKQKGLSEAEMMDKKAEAWSRYNEAAITQMFADILPEMARAVSEPLSKTEKIVMVSNDGKTVGANKITGDITSIISQLPTVIEGLTNVNLGELVKKIPILGEEEYEEYDEEYLEGEYGCSDQEVY